MTDHKAAAAPGGSKNPDTLPDSAVRRLRFGAAAEGWEAYSNWLDRVKQPGRPSRQAVIAKALYSVSSYKSWADKARGAFDDPE
jgi:hypothetical protein